MNSKMKRRDFLKVSALSSLALVAAAWGPTPTTKAVTATVPAAAPKAPEKTEIAFTGEIWFDAQIYTPTSEKVDPDPYAPIREAMKTLATEWMVLHPGIQLKFYFYPSALAGIERSDWLNVQRIGGTGPDIYRESLSVLNTRADVGWVVPLNTYLEMPNMHTPADTTTWKNTFKSPFQTFFSPKGLWGGIPMDLVSTGVYCNLELFDSVGIDLATEIVPALGSPADWATLISWCNLFKEAGINAFSMGMYILEWWLQGVLADQLFWNLTPTFDVLNYHTPMPMVLQENLISQEELIMQYTCNNWKAFAEPATRTIFEIYKELTQFMPDGFVNPDMWWSAYDLFIEGNLAMFWDGSWSVGPITQDTRREFDFSSFWLPPLTQATTPLAKDPPLLPIGVGGYGGISYGIDSSCIAKGNVYDCVDWLMFITTPEHDELVVNEVPSFVPSNKNSDSLPEVEKLFVGETRLVGGASGHPWPVPMDWFNDPEGKYTKTFKREMTMYLLDQQDLDTFMTHMDESTKNALPAIIRASAIQYSYTGSWDLTEWTCEPNAMYEVAVPLVRK